MNACNDTKFITKIENYLKCLKDNNKKRLDKNDNKVLDSIITYTKNIECIDTEINDDCKGEINMTSEEIEESKKKLKELITYILDKIDEIDNNLNEISTQIRENLNIAKHQGGSKKLFKDRRTRTKRSKNKKTLKL